MLALVFALIATNPATYGAVPNDGLDDGAAFRSALAAACGAGGDHLLEVNTGTYDLTQESGKLGSLNVSACSGLSIRGKGRAATRVRMIPKYMSAGQDWYLINIDSSSSDVEIADLVLDGQKAGFSSLGATAEQVHLIRGNVVDRMDVHDADLVDSFGDCMKMIDVDDLSVVNVRCRGSRRDGIGSHSGSEDVRIVASSFSGISDNQISTEGGGGNARWTIVANSTGAPGSGSTISLDLSNGLKDVAVVANTINDSNVQLYEVERAALVGNTFSTTGTSSTGPLYLKGAVTYTTVSNNSIHSLGTGSETYCLRVATLDAARDPHSLSITGNVCQHAGSAGFNITSGLGRLALDANVIRSLASSGGTGIAVGQVWSADQRAVAIGGNVVTNEGSGVVLSGASATNASYDDIALVGNAVHSTKSGSYGVETSTWNHSPYNIPYPTRCRSDGNILDVTSTKHRNTGTVSPAPGPTEGCIPRGTDVVP